jgi:hypothetical protein
MSVSSNIVDTFEGLMDISLKKRCYCIVQEDKRVRIIFERWFIPETISNAFKMPLTVIDVIELLLASYDAIPGITMLCYVCSVWLCSVLYAFISLHYVSSS